MATEPTRRVTAREWLALRDATNGYVVGVNLMLLALNGIGPAALRGVAIVVALAMCLHRWRIDP